MGRTAGQTRGGHYLPLFLHSEQGAGLPVTSTQFPDIVITDPDIPHDFPLLVDCILRTPQTDTRDTGPGLNPTITVPARPTWLVTPRTPIEPHGPVGPRLVPTPTTRALGPLVILLLVLLIQLHRHQIPHLAVVYCQLPGYPFHRYAELLGQLSVVA